MRRDRPPPWWPEGEPWPPPWTRGARGAPWGRSARDARRHQRGDDPGDPDSGSGDGGSGWGHGGWGHGSEHRRGWHGPPGRYGPPWHVGPRRFRRRFFGAVLTVMVVVVGFGVVAGILFGDRRPDRVDRPDSDGRHPAALVVFAGAVLLIGGAGAGFAYRRLSRPVNDLLGAAGQVTEGDYDVDVEPGGPRELQSLAHAFNRMAARLGENDEQRRRFLADVSHELRTPLAVLQSGIEAQLDGIHARDDAHLASLLEETKRLGRLIDDLNTLALADAGKLVLHREPVDVVGVVEEAIAAHRPLAERTGVGLHGPPAGSGIAAGAAAGERPTLDADPTRLRQVLDNLLSNAVRHTPSGGEVAVDVAVEPGPRAGVRVTVTDDGPGFPPGQLGHLFERFTRPVDSQGSGLGLSITRDLVEAHGGTIEATNRPEGGARVSFTVPFEEGTSTL